MRRDFDREAVSFDYEQSALLVRMLLLDPELGERFRAHLAALAAGEIDGAGELTDALGTTWPELEERFRRWLRGP